MAIEWRRRWGSATLNFLAVGLATVVLFYVIHQNDQLAADGRARDRLLAVVQQEEAQLAVLVSDDLAGQRASAAGGREVALVIAGLERSLNTLCAIEGCGIPPITANVLPPPQTVHGATVTTSPKKAPPTTSTTRHRRARKKPARPHP